MGDSETTTSQGTGTSPERPVAPAASDQQAGQDVAQPQYVTLEQAKELAKEAAEEAFRRAQSLYSKGQAGLEKRIQADLKNLEKALDLQKKAGIEVTPEQEERLKQQVINQAFTSEEQPIPEQTSEQMPAQASEEEEPPDPITASAWRMMDRAGVDINEEDPEYKEFNIKELSNSDDPYLFLKAIEAAISAKQERLGITRPTYRTPTNAGAGGQPTSSYQGRRGLDLLKEWSRNSG